MIRKGKDVDQAEPGELTPEQAIARAKSYLRRGDKGKAELMQEIREGLVAAMLLEREAGENPKDAGKSTEGNARQSRKQYRELAELVMEVIIDDD